MTLHRFLFATILIVAAAVAGGRTAQSETAPGGTVVLRGTPQASPSAGQAAPGNQPVPTLPSRAGWDRSYDTSGFDRRGYDPTGYDLSYDTRGIDRSFDRSYDTTGFDRSFDRPR
jgi:hypothetical protein